MEHGRVNGAGAQKQACVPNVEHAGDAEITAPLGLLDAIAQDFRVVFPKRSSVAIEPPVMEAVSCSKRNGSGMARSTGDCANTIDCNKVAVSR